MSISKWLTAVIISVGFLLGEGALAASIGHNTAASSSDSILEGDLSDPKLYNGGGQ